MVHSDRATLRARDWPRRGPQPRCRVVVRRTPDRLDPAFKVEHVEVVEPVRRVEVSIELSAHVRESEERSVLARHMCTVRTWAGLPLFGSIFANRKSSSRERATAHLVREFEGILGRERQRLRHSLQLVPDRVRPFERIRQRDVCEWSANLPRARLRAVVAHHPGRAASAVVTRKVGVAEAASRTERERPPARRRVALVQTAP
eukprot:6157040-Prymnesium_polylepis.1